MTIMNELLSLAASIHRQCGRYTHIDFNMHGDGQVSVVLSVATGYSGDKIAFDWFRSGERDQMTLAELRDAMADYIVEHRPPITTSPGATIGSDDDRLPAKWTVEQLDQAMERHAYEKRATA